MQVVWYSTININGIVAKRVALELLALKKKVLLYNNKDGFSRKAPTMVVMKAGGEWVVWEGCINLTLK